jgi:hypothetical protein
MDIPSHLLISPDALRDAIRGAGLPVEGDDLPAMLAEIRCQVQAFIAETPALRDPSSRGLAVLRAASNLLSVIQKAAGGPTAPTYWLAAPSYRVPTGETTGLAGAQYPLLVLPYAPPADAGPATSLGEFTWLDAIDDALSSVIGRRWADEEAEEAQSVVQGVLTGHVPLARLQEELTLFEGDLVPWLDVIDEALSWARDALESAELGRRIGEAHDLVQAILTGHVPLERLLDPLPPEEPVYQLEGGKTGDG